MDENDPRRKRLINQAIGREQDRSIKKIDRIIEEDNDDEKMMAELEKLVDEEGEISEGGNTSVDSLMEDTPSNYNAAN